MGCGRVRVRGCLLLLGLLSVAGLGGCGGPSSGDGEPLSYSPQVARARQEASPEARAQKLIRIALEQAEAKDTYGAGKTLRLAADACEEIPQPAQQADAFAALGEAHATIGDRAPARRALESAKAAAEKVEDPERRAGILAKMGMVRGMIGDEKAEATLTSAKELAMQLEEPRGRTLAMVAVAESYHAIDQPEAAEAMLRQALRLLEQEENPRNRADAIVDVATAQAQLDQPGYVATFDLAGAAIDQIDQAHSKAHAMCNLAEHMSRAGLHAKTHELLAEADAVAHEIPEPDLQQQTVQRIRKLMGELPKPKAG